MAFSTLSLALCALCASTGALAVPSDLSARSSYMVKETHPPPAQWTKIGSALKSDIIHLQIGLRQGSVGKVEEHLLEISAPDHARYGQHLSAAEIDDLIKPSEETVSKVHAWLIDNGIHEVSFNPAKDWLSVSVPIEKAEQLLGTEYSTYVHSDGTTLVRAPEWSLPMHLHDHIDVVQPTTSFFRAARNVNRAVRDDESYPVEWFEGVGKDLFADSADAKPGSVASVCNITFTTPECIRTLYGTIDYKPQVPGKNQIGICNYLNNTNKRSDIKKFLKNFRPEAVEAADEFKIITLANADNDQGPYTPAQIAAEKNIEGNLDAELVLSISWPTPMTAFSSGGSPPFVPDAATTTDTNEPYLTFLNYALAQHNLPQVISTSYGDDEQSVPESYARRACSGFAQLGARGISVIFSSGDAGVGPNGDFCVSNKDNSSTFLPAFPAGCPWVTTVGATQGFQPEVAIQRFASGAGFSNYFSAPKYQKKTVDAYIQSLDGLHDGLYNKSGRGYPDVAAQGDHDAIVWAGNITTVGGTSASSPTFGAVIALVNDALIAKGKPSLGFLNPWIYSGAYEALTDITNGSSYGCNTNGFPAKKGWDAVTGFGTPNFSKLVNAALNKRPSPYSE